MIASEITGTPWSMTLHRWDIGANNLLARKISSACFTRVISQTGAAELSEVVPNSRPIVLHMGIDVSTGSRLDDFGRSIACIASLVPVKNHAGLLAAFRAAAGDREVTLDLVGDGPLRADLEQRAEQLGLGDRVRFLGTLDHREVVRRLHAHDWSAVVLASGVRGREREGIPVSLMEAMAAGVPVVATASGGTAELLGSGAGLLVPVGDEEALTDAVRRMLDDDRLRRTLAGAGRRRVVEEFDCLKIAAELRRRFVECAR